MAGLLGNILRNFSTPSQRQILFELIFLMWNHNSSVCVKLGDQSISKPKVGAIDFLTRLVK